MRLFWTLALAFLWTCPGQLWATSGLDKEAGLPLLQSWAYSELNAHVQNWDVIQAESGLIYVANGQGVLEFDGVNWRLIQTPHQTRVRDLLIHQGKIFAATSDDFAVLSPDQRGVLQWQSLLTQADSLPAIGEVYQIIPFGDALVFLTRDQLLILSEGQLTYSATPASKLYSMSRVKDQIWVATTAGELFSFDINDQSWQLQARFPDQQTQLRKIEVLKDGRVLLLTAKNGLFWFKDNQIEAFSQALQQAYKTYWLYDMIELDQGGYLFASIQDGLLLADETFQILRRYDAEDGLFSGTLTSLVQDDQGGIWIAGELGISRLIWPSSLSRYQAADGELGFTESLIRFRGQLWLTAMGVYRLDTDERSLKAPVFTPLNGWTLQSWDLLPFGDDLLISAATGLYQVAIDKDWNIESQTVLVEMEFAQKMLQSRFHDNRIYLTGTQGLFQLDFDSGAWQVKQLLDLKNLSQGVEEDESGNVWVGSDTGVAIRLSELDQSRAQVQQFGVEAGLSEGNVVPIKLLDKLYFGTTSGLRRFDQGRFIPAVEFKSRVTQPDTEVYRAVEDRDGNIWFRLANETGVLHKKAGQWYWDDTPFKNLVDIASPTLWTEGRYVWLMQGNGQVSRFDQSVSQVINQAPKLNVRSMKLLGRDEPIFGGAKLPANKVQSLTSEQNAFRLEYALSRFHQNHLTQYRTRLKGMEREWTPWSKETFRDFTNVSHGNYQFELEARDIAGEVYTAQPIRISIASPWFLSPFAKVFYVLLLVLFMAFLFFLGQYWRRERQKHETLKLEKLVADRTKEVNQKAVQLRALNDAKSRFFANVSHEFRTPLTLTIGPLEAVLEQSEKLPASVREYLKLSLSNSRRMLSLVGQILDVNRLEAGKMPLRVSESDLSAFLRGIADRFGPKMAQMKLSLETQGLDDPYLHYFDPDHMDKIVSNLLSNAMKFTPEGRQVTLSLAVAENDLIISVEDTGMGIMASELDQVFKRYFQSEHSYNPNQPGTGIGLSLCKELVELLGGKILVESEWGTGSVFSIRLPRDNSHFRDEDLIDLHFAQGEKLDAGIEPVPNVFETALDDRMTVLIVDDNRELRAFIRMRLESQFKIIEAENGEKGLFMAREFKPDLIVSDQMMPIMDGLALLQAIRSEPELRLIPVILLSARSTKRDTVEGLNAGADDYLCKPFDSSELIVRITGLLARKTVWQAHSADTNSNESEAIHPHDENRALAKERILDQIQQHLSDSAYSIELLAQGLQVERSTLYRQTKDLFDASPSELLRKERLKKAVDLLHDPHINISQVAYAVGFESLAYFSKVFKQVYQISPKQFQKSSQIDKDKYLKID